MKLLIMIPKLKHRYSIEPEVGGTIGVTREKPSTNLALVTFHWECRQGGPLC